MNNEDPRRKTLIVSFYKELVLTEKNNDRQLYGLPKEKGTEKGRPKWTTENLRAELTEGE